MNFGDKKIKIEQVEQILQLFKVERFVIFWTMNLRLFFTYFMLNNFKKSYQMIIKL